MLPAYFHAEVCSKYAVASRAVLETSCFRFCLGDDIRNDPCVHHPSLSVPSMRAQLLLGCPGEEDSGKRIASNITMQTTTHALAHTTPHKHHMHHCATHTTPSTLCLGPFVLHCVSEFSPLTESRCQIRLSKGETFTFTHRVCDIQLHIYLTK